MNKEQESEQIIQAASQDGSIEIYDTEAATGISDPALAYEMGNLVELPNGKYLVLE